MSLLDALLLEGYRDPRDIYIALRADGQKGSGTIDDPYDGGTRQGPSISGAPSYDLKEVVVFTPIDHSYNTNDSVQINNVTGPSASVFNQAHQITKLNNREFKFLLPSVPTAPPGPRDRITCQRPDGSSPLDGIRLFWPVAMVDSGATTHGYSNFEVVTIAGAAEAALNGTTVIVGVESTKFRLRLLAYPSGAAGSSCTCVKTIHRFDEVMRATLPNAIIHLGPGTFETRGLCSAYSSNQNDYSQLYVGWALKNNQRLLGSGIDVTVLRLVHAADSFTLMVAIGSFVETSHTEAVDLTVDCNMGGQPVPAKLDFAPFSCGAVNFGGSFNRLRRIRAINFGTQAYPECFVLGLTGHYAIPKVPVNNVISECIIEKPSENNTHESTIAGCIGLDPVSALGRALVVRHCFVNCGYANGVSSEILSVQSIDSQPTWNSTRQQWEFKITTKRPHNRAANNNVLINGVTPDTHVLNNGSFTVAEKISDTQMWCKSPYGSFATFGASGAFIGVDFHGPSATGASGCVTEGNSVFDCQNPFYTDTGVSRSLILRNNYYFNVLYGIYFNFNPDYAFESFRYADDAAEPEPVPLTHSGTLATFRAKEPHRLLVGQVIKIEGARVGGVLSSLYNGTFSVESISSTDNRVFSYRMKGVPTGNADRPDATHQISFQAYWQVNHYVVEDNVFDVYRTDNNSVTPARGILMYGFEGGPPYVFPEMAIRANVMRHLDHAPSTAVNGLYSAGLRLDGLRNAIVQENIIDFGGPNPNHHLYSENVRSFNNTTASGMLVRGHKETYPDDPQQRDDELASRIEDAMVLSL
jgi:hypothetical protein